MALDCRSLRMAKRRPMMEDELLNEAIEGVRTVLAALRGGQTGLAITKAMELEDLLVRAAKDS